jgi:hypothetical protein
MSAPSRASVAIKFLDHRRPHVFAALDAEQHRVDFLAVEVAEIADAVDARVRAFPFALPGLRLLDERDGRRWKSLTGGRQTADQKLGNCRRYLNGQFSIHNVWNSSLAQMTTLLRRKSPKLLQPHIKRLREQFRIFRN